MYLVELIQVKYDTNQITVNIVNIASRRFLHNHGDFATEGSPKSGLCPTLIEGLQRFFIVHSTIDSTAHSTNGLEQC